MRPGPSKLRADHVLIVLILTNLEVIEQRGGFQFLRMSSLRKDRRESSGIRGGLLNECTEPSEKEYIFPAGGDESERERGRRRAKADNASGNGLPTRSGSIPTLPSSRIAQLLKMEEPRRASLNSVSLKVSEPTYFLDVKLFVCHSMPPTARCG